MYAPSPLRMQMQKNPTMLLTGFRDLFIMSYKDLINPIIGQTACVYHGFITLDLIARLSLPNNLSLLA
jgi:hypothetical protein